LIEHRSCYKNVVPTGLKEKMLRWKKSFETLGKSGRAPLHHGGSGRAFRCKSPDEKSGGFPLLSLTQKNKLNSLVFMVL
jgi:hypothetical protein